MSNKPSFLSLALKVAGISTIVFTVILAIMIIVISISNEAEAVGILIAAAMMIIGVFFGLIEFAASELLHSNHS